MNDLVLIKPIGSHMEPYTTTDRIAEFAQVSHKAVNQLTNRHTKDLELFGTVEFDVEACPHKTGASVRKIYHLNEQQATLFITYLQNTEPVRKFKKQLVRDFYAMREELTRRAVMREADKPTQHTLTDAIRDSGEDVRMHGQAYNTYLNLVYKAALGVSATQIRLQRNAPKKAHAVDFLTSEELALVTREKQHAIALLDMGFCYDEVKRLLMRRCSCAD